MYFSVLLLQEVEMILPKRIKYFTILFKRLLLRYDGRSD